MGKESRGFGDTQGARVYSSGSALLRQRYAEQWSQAGIGRSLGRISLSGITEV